jgi:uncharacterized membrane protein
MRVARWPARKALDHWRKTGLLTAEQVDALRTDLEAQESRQSPGRAVTIFATIGAVLVGLGVILFVASNWARMGPVARVLVLSAGYLAAAIGAMWAEKSGLPKIANSVWVVVTLLLGANIMLIAQIFNHSLTYWQGPLLWMAGAVAMGYARKSPAQGAIAVPLGLLALGWIGGGSGWFMDDQIQFLVSPGGLRPLLPLIGLGLIAAALLLRRGKAWGFGEAACFKWGTLLIVLPLIISTVNVEAVEWIFGIDFTTKQILILSAVGVLVASAVWFGRTRAGLVRPVLIGLALLFLLLIVPVDGRPWLKMKVGGSHLPYAIYVIGVFVLTLLAIGLGVRTQNPALINTGIYSVAVLIVIQYFSWSFLLLDRSLVFIIGGILLIVMAMMLEKKRRALVSRIAS